MHRHLASPPCGESQVKSRVQLTWTLLGTGLGLDLDWTWTGLGLLVGAPHSYAPQLLSLPSPLLCPEQPAAPPPLLPCPRSSTHQPRRPLDHVKTEAPIQWCSPRPDLTRACIMSTTPPAAIDEACVMSTTPPAAIDEACVMSTTPPAATCARARPAPPGSSSSS